MFNTLKYTKLLEAAGVSRQQAETHVQIIAEIVEDRLATKQDLKELEYRLTLKLGTMVTVIVGFAVTFLTFVIKFH
jgi:hypothetical protein